MKRNDRGQFREPTPAEEHGEFLRSVVADSTAQQRSLAASITRPTPLAAEAARFRYDAELRERQELQRQAERFLAGQERVR